MTQSVDRQAGGVRGLPARRRVFPDRTPHWRLGCVAFWRAQSGETRMHS